MAVASFLQYIVVPLRDERSTGVARCDGSINRCRAINEVVVHGARFFAMSPMAAAVTTREIAPVARLHYQLPVKVADSCDARFPCGACSVMVRTLQARPSGNRQAILDGPHARRGPCRGFDGTPFVPIVDLALENDLVAVLDGNADGLRFHLGMPLQG